MQTIYVLTGTYPEYTKYVTSQVNRDNYQWRYVFDADALPLKGNLILHGTWQSREDVRKILMAAKELLMEVSEE